MKALPLDATINLFDLAYKTKKVLEERASARGMQIFVDGVRAVVPGSQKSFPIVPAVLIENGIKYGRVGTTIRAEIRVAGKAAVLSVDNETEHPIDPVRCFDRGTRFAGGAAEQKIEFLTEEAVKFLAELLIEIGHHPGAELEAPGRILGRPAGRLHDAVHGDHGADDDFRMCPLFVLTSGLVTRDEPESE